MKVTRAAAKQLKAVESIEERLDRLETNINRILAYLEGGAPEDETLSPADDIQQSIVEARKVVKTRGRKAG